MRIDRTNLPPGYVLTVTADAVSSGSVRRIGLPGAGTNYAATAVAASGSTTAGPFIDSRNYEIVSDVGALTYAIAISEQEIDSVTAAQISDSTAAGRAMLTAASASAQAALLASDINSLGSYFVSCVNTNTNAAKADDESWLLIPFGYNSFSSGILTSIPAEMTKFRVRVSAGFTTNPASDTFPVYVRFGSPNINSTTITESAHGNRVGIAVYPDTAGGLTGTLTDLAVGGGYANTFSFTSDWYTIPAAWVTNAAAAGGFGLYGIVFGNKSGGSLTDNFNQSHSILGQIEFRR